jgi:uncharacterized membrane protein
MKLIKMKISRDHTSERTHYTYPKEYNASKILFGPVYESSLPENFQIVAARGDADESILIGVSDEDAPGFLASLDAQELTYKEAEILGNVWTRQVERIVAPNKVLALVAKAVSGKTLTRKEKDALDPDSPEFGINKSKSFKDSLDEALATDK